MNIVTPKIELVASTTLTNTNTGATKVEDWMRLDPEATDAESLVEFGGRGCYESWTKPNVKTAHNPDYIRRTAFDMAHGSILEHASATFRFSGVSRAWLTEMERHRHLSWSVVSQRYVDAATFGVVVPPAIRDYCDPGEDLERDPFGDIFSFINDANDALANYREWVNELSTECGLPRKQAREAARSVLPNCTEVRGVVTGNLRAWSTILPLRAAAGADAEMQEVSMLILDALEPVAPTVASEIRQQIENDK